MTTETAIDIWEKAKAGVIPANSQAAMSAIVRLAEAYASGWRIEDLRVLRLHAAILAALPLIEADDVRGSLMRAINETSSIQQSAKPV